MYTWKHERGVNLLSEDFRAAVPEQDPASDAQYWRNLYDGMVRLYAKAEDLIARIQENRDGWENVATHWQNRWNVDHKKAEDLQQHMAKCHGVACDYMLGPLPMPPEWQDEETQDNGY